jgi:hypothetical protein
VRPCGRATGYVLCATRRKITELEEELRIVGNNMKSLEISEQEATTREESYEETIHDLTEKLKIVRPPSRHRHR